jgi:hypothetical protein
MPGIHYNYLSAILKHSKRFIKNGTYIKVYFLQKCDKFFLLFYYSYVHTRLGSFLRPVPTPSLTPYSAPSLSPPSIPSRNYFALISNFVVERV